LINVRQPQMCGIIVPDARVHLDGTFTYPLRCPKGLGKEGGDRDARSQVGGNCSRCVGGSFGYAGLIKIRFIAF
jgi:hypothetical protein